MGYRNHLHVCQHCGVVHATASPTPPAACVVCDAFTFSASDLNDLLGATSGADPRPRGADADRASPVGRS